MKFRRNEVLSEVSSFFAVGLTPWEITSICKMVEPIQPVHLDLTSIQVDNMG